MLPLHADVRRTSQHRRLCRPWNYAVKTSRPRLVPYLDRCAIAQIGAGAHCTAGILPAPKTRQAAGGTHGAPTIACASENPQSLSGGYFLAPLAIKNFYIFFIFPFA